MSANESTKGFYFGFFWVFFMSSELLGNAVGGYIITQASGPLFFLIMGGISLSAVFAFSFTILPNSNEIDDDSTLGEIKTSIDAPVGIIADIKSTINLIFDK